MLLLAMVMQILPVHHHQLRTPTGSCVSVPPPPRLLLAAAATRRMGENEFARVSEWGSSFYSVDRYQGAGMVIGPG